MKTLTILAAGALAALPAFAPAAGALDWVPADAEVVVSANVRQVADSKFFAEVVKTAGAEEKLDAQMQIVTNLTGSDLRKDLDRVTLSGRIDDDASFAVLIQGRLDEAKLSSLLQVNPDHKTVEVKGVKVHEWNDKGDKRTKYGAFLAPDTAGVFNSKATLEAALAAKESGKGFASSPKAELLPKDRDAASAWGLIIKPERAMPNGKFKETFQAKSVHAAVVLGDEEVTVRLSSTAVSKEAAELWLDAARGLIAVAKLQGENAELHKIATGAKTSLDAAANTVSLELTLPNAEVIKAMKKKGDKKK